jgi:proteasome lid subunit RPN8/RPN11
MLRLTGSTYGEMIAHAYDGLPEEACGLLAGDPRTHRTRRFFPCRNAAESSKVYSIDPLEYARTEDAADAAGLTIIGVMHSHTHPDPYPSPTDVEMAFDPAWHYVIVSLRDEAPMLRSYAIVDGTIAEEPVILEGR